MILLISSQTASDLPARENTEPAVPKLAIYALWSKPASAPQTSPLTSQCAEAASFQTKTAASEASELSKPFEAETLNPESESASDPLKELSKAPEGGEDAPCRWDLVESGVVVAPRDTPTLSQKPAFSYRSGLSHLAKSSPDPKSVASSRVDFALSVSELPAAELTGMQRSGMQRPSLERSQTKRSRTKPPLLMPLDERDAPCADCSW